MLIDTHCHLADPAFAPDREAVMERMRAAGVGRALVVESVAAQLQHTLTWVDSQDALGLATACHPHDARHWDGTLQAKLLTAWQREQVRAVGEIGLDYHYDFSPRDAQARAFRDQLAMAVELGMPVVIHAREADEDVVAILRKQPSATVVLHSFSSGPALSRAGLDHGWYFSFSGMVTFKSWTQAEIVRAVPATRLLLETDSPYLAPVPHRGRRNEPGFVVEVARRVAEIREVPFEDLATATTANALRLFWGESTPATPT